MTLMERAVREQPCSLCGAKKGDPCVYQERPDLKNATSPLVIAIRDRAGKPTKRPHNGRMKAVRNSAERAKRQQAQERYAQRNQQSREARDAMRAYHAAVQDEYMQMREWLAKNHGLFGLKRTTRGAWTR